MASDLKRRLAELEFGDHLYLLYADEGERLSGLAPALREAFRRGHRCFYFADGDSAARALRSLADEGLEVDALKDEGSLQVFAHEPDDVVGGSLDPDAVLDVALAKLQ